MLKKFCGWIELEALAFAIARPAHGRFRPKADSPALKAHALSHCLRQNVAAECCKVMQRGGGIVMRATKGHKVTGRPRQTRASASLPPGVYTTLQDIAKKKKVSVAWVIRDAAEKYIADQWPLLANETAK